MPIYKAPMDDIKFVLHDVIGVEKLSEYEGYEEATRDLVDAVLEEGARLCEEVLQPLNLSGDQEGCTWHEDGAVTTPKGFKEAYQQYIENGWTGMSADPNYGGQGLPHVLMTVMQEIICSANFSFGMYPGLSHGAYDALHLHGSDDLKNTYLPKMVEGVWSGTMNLTEPHCGTDLGLIKTKAIPNEDGSYNVTGTKIFISAGEHDLTENIIHLVLAKLPDAPEGTRGISLFVVPKFLVKEDGSLGERNGVACGSIEHKMGIHANSTCVMNFEEAKGWLVGQPHKGLKAMFTMMNAARLAVGMQGLGIGEVAYQNAVAYAKDRLQGRSLSGTKQPDKPADSIIHHPDVRRMLLTMKSFNEGARMLAYWCGYHIDRTHKEGDESSRQESDDLVSLLTPIIKSYLTDKGFEAANLAMQTYGGHGYIAEYGVEQFARDARIAQIYEGTNGIQALDLVGRKMGQNMGRLLRRFFHPAGDFIEKHQSNTELAEFVFPFAKTLAKLQQATANTALLGLKDKEEAGAASMDYLNLFALNVMAYCWLQMVVVAQDKLENGGDLPKEFYESKIKTAKFFFARILPEADSYFKKVMAGKETLMALDESAF